MSKLWTGIILLSILSAAAQGKGEELTAATLEGAGRGVEVALSLCGALCLWTGILEVMRQSGLCQKLAHCCAPLLRWLYPEETDKAREYISANFTANLLGLGNAATPLGISAAQEINKKGNHHALYLLVVCNTASVQLIPSTVASLRLAEGCATPFDLLPAVWCTSIFSVTVGITLCKICKKFWRD
ncbi:MAG: spore maturation protein A [Eubacteriales bacterium]